MPDDKMYSLEQVRACYAHRAKWLYYLSQGEAQADGSDGPLHKAIRACGHADAAGKFAQADDLAAFAEVFKSAPACDVFEMEQVELTKDVFSVDFHTCPLVEAWKAAGCSPEEIDALCDIAMDGDRGIVEGLGWLEFDLQDTIARGGDVCKIRITRKKGAE